MSIARLIKMYFMQECLFSSSGSGLFVSKIRTSLPLYARKRTSTHFATTENLPNPVASVGCILASHVFLGTLERIYLNDELWGKKGVCVERVSSPDVTDVGAGAAPACCWGNCQQSSGLGSAVSCPASEVRCLTSSSDCSILEANVASSWQPLAASAAVWSCFHPDTRVCCARPGTNVFVAISQTTVFWWFPF